MAYLHIYSTDEITVSADDEKHHVHIELSSSGYRPRYVSVYIEKQSELDELIEALKIARTHVSK